MNWPLCPVALFYLGGILLGQWLHPSLAGLFTASFLAVAAAMVSTRARPMLLTVGLILAGWTNASWRSAILSPADLRNVAVLADQAASVRGALHASPIPRLYERQGKEFWHSSVVIDTTAIQLANGWHPARGKIIAYASGILGSNFFNGQEVQVSGVLGPLSGPLAEGLFDARSYYEHEGIYFELRTESVKAWNVVPASPRQMPLSDRFSRWARQALSRGLPEDEALRLMWTLALDWRAPLTESVEEPFMRAGTFHIFAVDGLRIGMLSAICVGLFGVVRLPRWARGVLAVPLIWSYVALTGWPASAVRAAIMLTIVIAGWSLHRPVNIINSLFAAALVILLWEPAQLFQPGFQLSFLVVLCIALLVPLIQKLLKGWLFKKDPFLPDALRPRWPPAALSAAFYVVDLSALSLAAWLGSIPLAAAYFHLFTPVSIPTNILVVPIAALALMSAMGSLLTAGWCPALSVLFNHASWFYMHSIITLSGWAARWNPGSWNVATPSPVTFLLYYAALFSVLTGWIFRSRFKWAAIAGMVALAGISAGQTIAARSMARVYLLPLHGSSAVFAVNAEPGKNFLFDCGNNSAVENVTKPFLRAQGVNALDSFALTVGHITEAGGAQIILTNFPPRRLWLNPTRDRSSAYRDAMEAVNRFRHAETLQAGAMADGWTVLHPKSMPKFPDADDNALVFSRKIKGHSVLLLSSLGRSGQDALIEGHPDLRAEIVIASLPAKDEPLCEPLLYLLKPKLIVILDSDRPVTRRASPKLRNRLAGHPVPVIYCHETGALKLSFRNDGWELRNASGENCH